MRQEVHGRVPVLLFSPVFGIYRIHENCLAPLLSLDPFGVHKCMCVGERSLFEMEVQCQLPFISPLPGASHRGVRSF